MPYDGIWPRRRTTLTCVIPKEVYKSIETLLYDRFPPEQRYTSESYTPEYGGTTMFFVARLGRNGVSGGQLIISFRETQCVDAFSKPIPGERLDWSLQIDPYPESETPGRQVDREFGLNEAAAEIEIVQRGIEQILLEAGLI